MIADAFVYAIAVTLLIGLASLSVEQFLAEVGRPRRYAWLGGYVAALVFPPLSMLLAPRTPIVEPAVATSLAAGSAPSPFDWDTLLIQGWALATVVLLLAYVAAWLRLAMLARHWPRVASEKPLVALSDDVGPAVLGIFRPCIVLPRWLVDSPEAVRSTVMAHELEHVAARDQALIVAAQLVTVLLPWNLPLWWFARRLRASIEVDCDARVLRSGIDAEQYADVLLAVGQRRSASPHVGAALIEPVTQLERRIRIMLTRKKPGAALRATATAALALAVAACVTRVEPPVVLTDEEPSARTSEEPVGSFLGFLSRMPKRDPTERVELRNGFLAWSEDGVPTQATADRMTKTEDNIVLEGNVKIAFDRTTITASRAVAKIADDGTVALQLDDAVLTTRPGGAEEPL
jgi:hypothetical protein